MAGAPHEARVQLVCPSCGARAAAPARFAGRTVRCSRCQSSFRVPEVPSGPLPTVPEEVGPPPPTTPTEPAPGEWSVGDVLLGLYEVRAVLGEGGMGRVYQVWHRGWGVDLAVKTPLRQALAAAGGAEVFEREAETWVNLGLHPHTVSCYYVRRLEGVPRVFAEYVDGGSLAQAIHARRLVTAEAILDVAIQLAWGLHYAHERGLVHRDVKPANVMLTSDGVAKVTDFGLAGARVPAGAIPAATGEKTTIAPGGVGGTPAYMSPEQWAGQPLTRRTDVWGWALSVLEMFVGRRTWQLGPVASLMLDEHVASPGTLMVAMPGAVADLLRRCFAESQEERPRTMAEVADVLVDLFAKETDRPYPRGRPEGGRQTAGSLNNRAASLLDLGKSGAEALWAEALQAEPQHLESSYNHALHAWLHGRMGDDELLARVREAQRANGETARGAELLAHALHAVGDHAQAATTAPPRVPRNENDIDHPGQVVTVGRTFKGFTDAVEALAVAPDGSRVLASQGGSEVRVWLASGEAQRTLVPAELRVKAVAMTPDGRSAVLAGEGGPPEIWDVGSGRLVRTLARHAGAMTCLALTPDGRQAVGGSTDRALRVWELAGGRVLHVLEGHEEAVTCVAVSPFGSGAVSGGRDGTVRLWDLASGRPSATFTGHRGPVQAVAFGSGGAILSAGEDRLLRMWDPSRGAVLTALAGPSASVSAILVLEAPPRILVASLDRTVRTWDVGTQTLGGVARLEAPITAAAAAQRGASLWVASGSTVVELRPATVRRVPFALSRPVSAVEVALRRTEFEGRIEDARQSLTRGDLGRALALLREARTIPGHERADAALSLWDDATAALPRQKLESAWQAARLEGHRDPVVALAVSADGRRAMSGDLAGTLRWWDLGLRAEIGSTSGHEATVAAVALSADGGHAASASWDHTVRLWEGPGGLLRTLEGHGDYVSGVALTPSGRTVLSASSDQTLRLWDFGTGRVLGVLEGHEAPVSACAFGPEGRFALSAGWDGTVRLWDVASRAAAGVLRGHEGSVGAVAVAPSGREAASGGLDRAVRVWDLAGRRLARSLTGHEAEVTTVAFFPDGRHLVSASRDKTVRLWDAAGGTCLRMLSHGGAVLSAAPLPSGNGLLCGGTELALALWRLDWEADASAATIGPRSAATLRPGRETVAIPAPATESKAWEEIQRAAPRAAAREATVQAARRARRALPRVKVVMIAGLLVASVLGAYFVLRPRRVELGFSHHRGEMARQEVAVVDVVRSAGTCGDGYEQYLERARARVVPDDVIGCLARLQPPGLVEAYFRDMQLEDEEPTLAQRKRRNAVSLMAALGDSAVSSLCQALQSGGEQARWVSARALGLIASPDATECLSQAIRHSDPAIRVDAITGLRIAMGRGALPVRQAWELAGSLRQDPDPKVRQAAISVVALFDHDHTQAALTAMESDPDPQVASLARQTRVALKSFHDLNPDLPY